MLEGLHISQIKEEYKRQFQFKFHSAIHKTKEVAPV